MMNYAGALNVGEYKQVSMEQILTRNPQDIFFQNRYLQIMKEINTQPAWQAVEVVKNYRVCLMPEYAKAWGYPKPEAMVLDKLWMAQKLYPQSLGISICSNGPTVDISAFSAHITPVAITPLRFVSQQHSR